MTTGVANSLNTGTPASGYPLIMGGPNLEPAFQTSTAAGGHALISTLTASSSASIPITNYISSTYNSYTVIISNLIMGTSTANLLLEYSTNNGTSWDTTAAHYAWVISNLILTSSPGPTYQGNASDTSISICRSMSASLNASIIFDLVAPSTTSVYCFWQGVFATATPTQTAVIGSGNYLAGAAINAFRFIPSSGNITSGTFKLFGWSA